MIGMGASRAAGRQCCAALRWSRAPWTLASVGVRRMLVDAGAWGVERVLCLDACGLSPFNMWVTVWLIAAKSRTKFHYTAHYTTPGHFHVRTLPFLFH
jgi:hypothetical protein